MRLIFEYENKEGLLMAKKKSFKDRRDGIYLGELDPLHVFVPYLLPNRADNEAFISESVEMDVINEFLAKKNAENPAYKYTIFHVVAAAIAKVLYLRPKMNRYITGYRIYQRKDISLVFVAKKLFSDDGEEALLYIKCGADTTIDTLHDEICSRVSGVREHGETDNNTDVMTVLAKLPRFMLKIFIGALNWLEYHDLTPDALYKEDPYHASVFISNLGSIKLNAAYHHLTNWGTNSLFLVIGEKHMAPRMAADGSLSVREVLDLGITIDERIADGYYYAKTIRLFKHLLANPELLELPANTPVVLD